jgi:hypothetical protein
MQEAYWADPAGRLYRWDLGTETSDATAFPHLADGGGGKWGVNPDNFAVATESVRFAACQGTDDFSCTVGSVGNGGAKGDVFTFSPAVVANNRIDDPGSDDGGVLGLGERDQFLIALASGSPNDNVLDGGDSDNDYHSSIYLIADDHRGPAVNAGFSIPANGPVTPPGTSSSFMRLPLNQIERTRTIHFPDGETEEETRNFSKAARPLRAPMVRVTGLSNGGVLAGEVFYVSFTVYEPGTSSCDSRWFNDETGEWDADPGATYEITFRLVVEDGESFNFNSGYALENDYSDGFGVNGGLSEPVVTQADCEGQNCGAVLKSPKTKPCDPNQDPPSISGVISVQTGWAELEGFSPLEVAI